MNNAKWLLPNPDIPKGNVLSSSYTISSSVWIILVTLLLALIIFLSRFLLRIYKKWKTKKNLELLEEESISTQQ